MWRRSVPFTCSPAQRPPRRGTCRTGSACRRNTGRGRPSSRTGRRATSSSPDRSRSESRAPAARWVPRNWRERRERLRRWRTSSITSLARSPFSCCSQRHRNRRSAGRLVRIAGLCGLVGAPQTTSPDVVCAGFRQKRPQPLTDSRSLRPSSRAPRTRMCRSDHRAGADRRRTGGAGAGRSARFGAVCARHSAPARAPLLGVASVREPSRDQDDGSARVASPFGAPNSQRRPPQR
jgi:hypothetical protein